MGEIIVGVGDRQIKWDIPDVNAAVIVQTLVQSLGPAKDVEK